MAKAKQVQAITTFAAVVDGKERLVHQGEVLPVNSPIVKGRKELFKEAEALSAPDSRGR
jgi:hypothetical protein